MRYLTVGAVLATVAVASAGAAVFDANQKISLSPAIAAAEGDVFVAWARLERMLKLGRFKLSPVHGGEAHLEASMALTSRTDNPFAMVWGDGALFLGWIDYRTGKAELARYKIK
ncbi:MAG: hypothetical protein JSU81_09015, partial [Candidatus Coatesbacteria bacterium]